MAAAIWWKVQDFYSWIKKKTVFFFFSQISPYEARKLKKERGPNWGRKNFVLEEGPEETDSTKKVSRQFTLALLVTVGSNF